MTAARLLSGIVALHLLSQGLLGGVGFGWFPEVVLGMPPGPEATLGFRLAGCTNLCAAGLGAVLVARGVAVRELAWAALVYHALAAVTAAQTYAAGGALAAVGASAGPFHVGLGVLLAIGLLVGRASQRGSARGPASRIGSPRSRT